MDNMISARPTTSSKFAGSREMMSGESYRALLLKSLITLLSGMDPKAVDEIRRVGDVPEEEFRSFMRLNAGDRALRSGFPGLLQGTVAYLREDPRRVSPEVRTMTAAITDEYIESPRVPFFLNPNAIRARMSQGIGTLPTFMNAYQGCWRVFRLSSDDVDDKPSNFVNRGFLNIKPQHVLEKEGHLTPLFSYYYREGRLLGMQEPGKSVGLVFPMAERATFLGTRLSEFNPYLVAMVWPMRRMKRASQAVGLSLMPSASGDHVAGYVWATWIEGSDRWQEEEYERHRSSEIKAVRRYDLSKTADYQSVSEAFGGDMSAFEALKDKRPLAIG